MNEQLKSLIALQELDSRIIDLAEQIEQIPRKLEAFAEPLKKARQEYDKKQSHFEELNKKKKARDLELDEMQDKIDKLKSRSGDIKTNKEYEAHLKEIQGFEDKMSAVEEDILVAMEALEGFEQEIQGVKDNVTRAEQELKAQEQLVRSEQEKISEQLDLHRSRRKEFTECIDKENLTRYMNLMKRLGDKAVVEAINEVCLGCNTNIPPQLFNDIKKDDTICSCYYCQRFLYYRTPSAEPAEPKAEIQEEGSAS